MKVKKISVRLNFTHYVALLVVLAVAAGFAGDRSVSASKPTSVVIWDGGGITNNWSEPANWSGDVVPGTGDDVIFDATSTKEATIDVNAAVSSIKIDTGYTGTITQSDAASIAVSGCSGRPCFQQNNGTFNGSSSTITLNNLGSGGLLLNGGNFNGGSGDISLTGTTADLSLQGGTFTSTSGDLTTRGTLRFQGTSVFQPGNGTVTIAVPNSSSFMATDSNHTTVTFNNLVFNNADGANFSIAQRLIVTGNLSLNDGRIGEAGSTIEVRGGLFISPNFDDGIATVELANGSGPRTFTLDSSLHLPKFVVNDPNVTINTSGPDAVTFPHQLILSAGVFNQGNDLVINAASIGGGFCYIQNGGTFNGSANTITLNSSGSGSLNVNGGTFNGGSGDISLAGTAADLSLQGGTFTSTSGNLTTLGTLRFQGTSVFQSNNGTVTIAVINSSSFMATDSNHNSVTFNNLVFNNADGANFSIANRLIVTGNLALNDGRIGEAGSTIEARGGLFISPNFDDGIATVELANGSGPRTFTLDSSLHLPKFVVNDPNVTINTSGPGAVTFPHQLILSSGVFNQGNNLVINASSVGGGFCYIQNGGTFNGSANTITLNSEGFGSLNVNGGTFNGGSGDINLVGTPAQNAELSLQGGSFRSTSGNLTVPGNFRFQGVGTIFLHNSGTVNFTAGNNTFFTNDSNHPSITFNNVKIDMANNANFGLGLRLIVAGNLSLNDGSIGQVGTTIEARGDVSISPNFDGGFGALEYANGSGTRNFTLTPDLTLSKIVVNDAAVTLNTSGPGTVTFPQGVVLTQGVFNQNDADLVFAASAGGAFCYQQNGGTFNGSANTITLPSNGFGSIHLTGGTFNGESGDINLVGTPAQNAELSLQGGTFRSTSGNLTVPSNFRFQGVGTVFLHNNGTVNFTAGNNTFFTNDSNHPSITFNNVNIDMANNANFGLGLILIAGGTLNLIDGSIGQTGTTIEARGPTVIGPNFDGGPTNFTFGGSSNQTFTNLGGVNPQGIWTVNKPTGIVTAATSLILQPTQPLNITSGTFFLGDESNLTAGAVAISGPGKLAADSSQTITLGGNLSNSGVVDLQGGGAGCPESDTILVRSSIPGTRRNWTGSGAFRLVDVDVQDQAGTAPVSVFSGTDSGDNGANFAFNSGCPTALSISPLSRGVVTNTSFQFIASGGIGMRTFSLAVNNSGGSIISGNGQYTAGPSPDVTDTVRVTDSLGSFTDATVDVAGPGAKLKFIQQPTDTAASSAISPPIQVAIQDQAGVTVTTATNTIVITISNNPGGGTLAGTATKTAVAGIATFDNLSINQIANGYTLRAGSNSLTAAISNSFNITTGAAASLQFTTQPQDVIAGAAIAPPVQVAIKDGLGNTVKTANDPVTISIGNNPGGSTLSGTLTRNAVSGVATFDDLKVNNPGTGYTLAASSAGLAGGSSNSFNVFGQTEVTNTNDSGPGSLRQAILTSNSTLGIQTITFNIPGAGPFQIAPTTSLPFIFDPVVIDGTSQPGFAGSPVVEIAGTFHGFAALFLAAGNSTVKGLSLTGHFTSIMLDGNGNAVQGNWIGITPNGVIDGSAFGIFVTGQNNLIGGADLSDRNVIAGNNIAGVYVTNAQNTIEGNFIGTDPTGTIAAGNGTGVDLENGSSNSVVRNNVISGNNLFGVNQFGDSSTGSVVQENIIGLDATGLNPLTNTAGGVVVKGTAASVRITGNRIFSHLALGIRLGTVVSPMPNDPQDFDIGPNGLQNYPVLTSAFTSGGTTSISGSLNSAPTRSFTLEFFSSGACNLQGFGDGETFLGSSNISTDSGGLAPVSVTLPFTVATGRFITATATDSAGNTSEFSNCTAVVPRNSITGRVTVDGVPQKNILVRALQGGINTTTSTDSQGKYTIKNLPNGATVTLTPSSSGVNFSPGSRALLLTSDVVNQDFAGTLVRYNVKGRATSFTAQSFSASRAGVRRRGNVIAAASSGLFAMGGVTMTLSGTASVSVTTDGGGRYNFGQLVPGNYTLTPTKLHVTFTPPSVSFTITSQDVAQDFTGESPGLDSLPGRITYDSNGSIKAINANSTGQVTLMASRGTAFSEPNLSLDGTRLTGINSGGGSSVFTASFDGKNPVTIRRSPGQRSPSWSPSGTKIAFADSAPRVLTMNADGTAVSQAVADCVSPDWSIDNIHLVCVRSGLNIFTTASGSIFSATTGTKITARWSPDGTKIAFIDKTIPNAIRVMNPAGSGVQTVVSSSSDQFLSLAWSPDNDRLAFVRHTTIGNRIHSQLVSILLDGQFPLVINDGFVGTNIDWSVDPVLPTPPGSNINVQTGNASVTFPGVTGAGAVTTIIPIDPAAAGSAPNGFVLGSVAFDISTTANFTPPALVCLTMPSTTTLAQFNLTSLLHNENGVLVNRTTSRNFATKQICGQVFSFSPLVLAEQIDPALPSITGVVINSAGEPMDEVPVFLTGAEDRSTTTDIDGTFTFANLEDGANYSVQPKQPGVIFSQYSEDLLGLTAENTVVFTGTPAAFSIGGRVADQNGNAISGASVLINGSVTDTVVSDANGNYLFTDLPADGIFSVSASNGVNVFSPGEQNASALISDVSGLDFTALIPTAAHVPISGHVVSTTGSGISGAIVSLMDARGQVRAVRTNTFGYFTFDSVLSGEAYLLNVSSRRYRFEPRLLSVDDSIADLKIVGVPF